MSQAQDTRDNTEAIKELTKQVYELNLKCEILTERLATIQRLVFGIVGLVLTGVVIAILKTIGI